MRGSNERYAMERNVGVSWYILWIQKNQTHSVTVSALHKVPLLEISNRFPLLSSKEMLRQLRACVVNQNSKWTKTIFIKWAQERNKCVHSHEDEVPLDLLQTQSLQVYEVFLF